LSRASVGGIKQYVPERCIYGREPRKRGCEMRVAIACQKPRLASDVAAHFGQAPAYIIYDTKSETVTKFASGSRAKMPRDGGLNVAVTLLAANVDAVIAGRFGHRVAEFFDGADVTLSRVSSMAGSCALDQFLRQREDRSHLA